MKNIIPNIRFKLFYLLPQIGITLTIHLLNYNSGVKNILRELAVREHQKLIYHKRIFVIKQIQE